MTRLSVTMLLAATSFVLYSLLAVVSLYCYYRLFCSGGCCHSRGRRESVAIPSYTNEHKSRVVGIIRMKKLFFIVLSVSAILDIPLYAECLYEGGPSRCEWNNMNYTWAWILHLVALCGYCVCVSIPPYMWSEIIRNKWKMSFPGHSQNSSSTGSHLSNCFNCCGFRSAAGTSHSQSPSFNIAKLIIKMSIICYIGIQAVTICVVLATAREHPSQYLNSKFDHLSFGLESLFILMMMVTWLWIGVSLQRYVIDVKFERHEQKKILYRINIILFVLVICYSIRAVLIFSKFSHDNADLDRAVGLYALWLVGTRWAPYILCSLLLIQVMQRRAGGRSRPKAGLRFVNSLQLEEQYEHECDNEFDEDEDGDCSAYGSEVGMSEDLLGEQAGSYLHTALCSRIDEEYEDMLLGGGGRGVGGGLGGGGGGGGRTRDHRRGGGSRPDSSIQHSFSYVSPAAVSNSMVEDLQSAVSGSAVSGSASEAGAGQRREVPQGGAGGGGGGGAGGVGGREVGTDVELEEDHLRHQVIFVVRECDDTKGESGGEGRGEGRGDVEDEEVCDEDDYLLLASV